MERDFEDTVKLNISGKMFQVKVSTLRRFPNSRLSSLVDKVSISADDNAIYFDQDPEMFGYILRCCRSGEVHVPKHVCGHDFIQELEYWGIPLKEVSPCCLPTLYQADVNVEILQKLAEVTSDSTGDPEASEVLTIREKIWNSLNNPNYSLAAKVWFYCYLSVVMLSIVVYFLWMMPSLRVPLYLNDDLSERNPNFRNNKISGVVESDPHVFVLLVDAFCVFFFSAEYFIRFATCPQKDKFFKEWYNIVNGMLVITTTIAFIFEMRKDFINSNTIGVLFYTVKTFNLFRLLLMLRLEKQFMGLKLLILSVKNSTKELFLLLFSLIMATCVFGGLIFCAEIHTATFPNISIALWWALVTITTVGYGDYVPSDLTGRVIGSLCAACGVMLLALPIAVVVSNFASLYEYSVFQRMHKKVSKKQNINSLSEQTVSR